MILFLVCVYLGLFKRVPQPAVCALCVRVLVKQVISYFWLPSYANPWDLDQCTVCCCVAVVVVWPRHMARGILVPLPGIQPMPPAVEAQSPTTGPPGKSPL